MTEQIVTPQREVVNLYVLIRSCTDKHTRAKNSVVPKIDKSSEQAVLRLAKLLQKTREEQSLSKNELSQRSGVSRTSILRIEQGERSPSIYILMLLAKSLDVDLWKLLKEAETGK